MTMTEAEACAALRALADGGSIEDRIVDMPWEPAPDGGWIVLGDILGLRFRLARALAGVRIVVRRSDGVEVAWFVPAQRCHLRSRRWTGLMSPLRGAGRNRRPVRRDEVVLAPRLSIKACLDGVGKQQSPVERGRT